MQFEKELHGDLLTLLRELDLLLDSQLQGLRNLGPTLRRWRTDWHERLPKNPASDLSLPAGAMNPAGYVFMQHFARDRRPVKAFDRWMQRIPNEYRVSVLDEPDSARIQVDADPYRLGRKIASVCGVTYPAKAELSLA